VTVGGAGLLRYFDFFRVCTLTNNSANSVPSGNGRGGGIYNASGEIEMSNSIVWGNSDDDSAAPLEDAQIKVAGGLGDVFFSCIQDDNPNAAPIPFGGSSNGNIDGDPLFIDAMAADPENDNLHLQIAPESPCVDAGDIARLPVDQFDLDGDGVTTGEKLSFDLDLKERVTDAVDMGVFEVNCRLDTDCVDDGVACTNETCDLSSNGCFSIADDTNCPDDGLFCTGTESCDAVAGCVSSGDPCGALVCDDVTDTCVCQTDNQCDDGLFCTGVETCVATACQAGTPPVIDDGVPCTDDSCDDVNDVVVHTPNDVNCDNGLFCDGAETCDPLLDCQAGIPLVIDDGVACTDDSCDEVNGVVVHTPNDVNCDNGLFCDGAEICDALMNCQAGMPPNCDDGVPCTDDSCDQISDLCVNTANDANCDNGLFCDGAETCNVMLDCQAGTNPCLDPEPPLCDELGNACVACLVAGDCDDASVCTFDQCIGSTCSNVPNTYGDVDHNGLVNIFDLFCVLDGFSGIFTECTFADVDIEPCASNAEINIFDLFAVLDAFSAMDPCCSGGAGGSGPARTNRVIAYTG